MCEIPDGRASLSVDAALVQPDLQMRGFASGAGAGDVGAASGRATTREVRLVIAVRRPPVEIDPEPVGARALRGGASKPDARATRVAAEA